MQWTLDELYNLLVGVFKCMKQLHLGFVPEQSCKVVTGKVLYSL